MGPDIPDAYKPVMPKQRILHCTTVFLLGAPPVMGSSSFLGFPAKRKDLQRQNTSCCFHSLLLHLRLIIWSINVLLFVSEAVYGIDVLHPRRTIETCNCYVCIYCFGFAREFSRPGVLPAMGLFPLSITCIESA